MSMSMSRPLTMKMDFEEIPVMLPKLLEHCVSINVISMEQVNAIIEYFIKLKNGEIDDKEINEIKSFLGKKDFSDFEKFFVRLTQKSLSSKGKTMSKRNSMSEGCNKKGCNKTEKGCNKKGCNKTEKGGNKKGGNKKGGNKKGGNKTEKGGNKKSCKKNRISNKSHSKRSNYFSGGHNTWNAYLRSFTDTDVCQICNDDFTIWQWIFSTSCQSCGKNFHVECISDYFKTLREQHPNRTTQFPCPNCRFVGENHGPMVLSNSFLSGETSGRGEFDNPSSGRIIDYPITWILAILLISYLINLINR